MPANARKIRINPEFSPQRPLLTRVEEALEVRQERIDVDVRQFLRRLGLVSQPT